LGDACEQQGSKSLYQSQDGSYPKENKIKIRLNNFKMVRDMGILTNA